MHLLGTAMQTPFRAFLHRDVLTPEACNALQKHRDPQALCTCQAVRPLWRAFKQAATMMHLLSAAIWSSTPCGMLYRDGLATTQCMLE